MRWPRMPRPKKPIAIDWPDAIRIDGGLVGGGRLGWPTGAADIDVPAWLVFWRHDPHRGDG